MKPKFILFYGVPGAGKTTLARRLNSPRVQYINLAEDPEFRSKYTLELLKEKARLDCHIITEGCFPNVDYRKKILNAFRETHSPLAIYLKESPEELSMRRDRSVGEYERLLEELQIFEDGEEHLIFDGLSLGGRITAALKLLNS